MSNTVYVGNLSYQMSEQELADVFSSIGNVNEAKIIQDRMTGRSRGFGFVEFSSGDDAQRAIDLNGKEIKGRNIFVSIAREKTSGGGGGHRDDRDGY